MPKPALQSTTPFLLIVVIAILVAALGLRIYEQRQTGPSVPLLLQTPDLIEVSHIADIVGRTDTPVSIPAKLFGSELYLIGIYPTGTRIFPKQSVSVIFTKNQARTFQMDVLPNTSFDIYTQPYTSYPQETVAIDLSPLPSPPPDKGGGSQGKLIHLRSGFDCTNPKPNTVPSICQITNLLIFEHNQTIIQLSTDGNHVSEGELIEIARSIP